MVNSLLTQCTRNWHTPGRQNCSQGEGHDQLKPVCVCVWVQRRAIICVCVYEREEASSCFCVCVRGRTRNCSWEREKNPTVDRRGRIPVEALMCHGRLVKTWKEGKQRVKRRESRESDQLPAWRRMRMRCWVFWTKFWRMKISLTMRWTWTVHSLQWSSGRLRWERDRLRGEETDSTSLFLCWLADKGFALSQWLKNSEVESIKPFFATWR